MSATMYSLATMVVFMIFNAHCTLNVLNVLNV